MTKKTIRKSIFLAQELYSMLLMKYVDEISDIMVMMPTNIQMEMNGQRLSYLKSGCQNMKKFTGLREVGIAS